MNKTAHSVMFHHFHNEKHIPSTSSLNQSDFKKMIDWLNKNYTLLNASEFKTKFKNGTLRDTDICLSFDDGFKMSIRYCIGSEKGLEFKPIFYIH